MTSVANGSHRIVNNYSPDFTVVTDIYSLKTAVVRTLFSCYPLTEDGSLLRNSYSFNPALLRTAAPYEGLT